jgi:broad specificity phosphatase PhoE
MSEPHGAEVVLARHGETEWSRSGQHTGRTDLPLTELGRRQGQALADVLGHRQFARVLTSPLRRATETCRLAGLGDQAELCPDLVEWDYGDYEGRTTADIRREVPGWSLFRDGVPNGETAEAVGRRADRVIGSIRLNGGRSGHGDSGHGDVALFAHGHILRVLAARWLGMSPAEGRHLPLGTATVSVLGWDREVPVLWRWNDDSHLLAMAAPEEG